MKDDLVVVADGGGIRPRTSWVHDWMTAVAGSERLATSDVGCGRGAGAFATPEPSPSLLAVSFLPGRRTRVIRCARAP
jgi:hypothetical protein